MNLPEESPCAEIASVPDPDESVVKSRLYEGMTRLRATLDAASELPSERPRADDAAGGR